MSDLKNIKDILSNYEMEYDPTDWVKLEKDLPKTKGGSNFSRSVIISSIVILTTIATIIFIYNVNNNDDNTNIDNKSISFVENNNELITNSNKEISNNINYENSISESQPKLNNTTNNTNNNITIENNVTDNKNNDIETNIENRQNNQNEDNIILTNYNEQDNNKIDDSKEFDNSQIKNTDNSGNIIINTEINNNCVPAKVIFYAENVPQNSKVYWDTDDGNKLEGNKAEHIYSKKGTYTPKVSIVNNETLLKSENLKTLNIYSPTKVEIYTENSKNNYTIFFDSQEELPSVIWNIDNQTFNDEKAVLYTFNKGGTHEISLTVINNYGCKTKVSKRIEIAIEPILYMPDAFRPLSNDGNSLFGPKGDNLEFKTYILIVRDVSGNIVFETHNVNELWNGRINNVGEYAKAGLYLWEMKTVDMFDNIKTQRGTVELQLN